MTSASYRKVGDSYVPSSAKFERVPHPKGIVTDTPRLSGASPHQLAKLARPFDGVGNTITASAAAREKKQIPKEEIDALNGKDRLSMLREAESLILAAKELGQSESQMQAKYLSAAVRLKRAAELTEDPKLTPVLGQGSSQTVARYLRAMAANYFGFADYEAAAETERKIRAGNADPQQYRLLPGGLGRAELQFETREVDLKIFSLLARLGYSQRPMWLATIAYRDPSYVAFSRLTSPD